MSAARTFHSATKYVAIHDAVGNETSGLGEEPNPGPAIGEQNPELEPFPFKVYTSLEPIPLPREFNVPDMPAIEALSASGEVDGDNIVPTLADLARICLLSNGLIDRTFSSYVTGTQMTYRAAGATGARYHLELYLICGELPDLAAGVYQYSAIDHSLRQLRSGDYRQVLVEATGADPAVAAAPVVVASTSTFWRNAWRYQDRAYRHAYWDTGTTFANLLALAASARIPTRVVFGFADDAVNALLDVDGLREATLALVPLGRSAENIPAAPEVTPLGLPTQQISPREIEFPATPVMHRASSLASGEAAREWRGEPLQRAPLEPGTEGFIPLRPLPDDQLPLDPIDDVIRRRRSVRHYDTDAPVSFEQFSTVVARSMRGFAADVHDPTSPPFYDQYLIVNNVEGLEPGIYVVHPDKGAVELVQAGNLRRQAQRIAVEQEYAAHAQVNVYYLTDLEPLLARYGDRGYRIAQLEAALAGGKLHLAAHVLRLGAVGSTSYDNEVIELFSPHAAGKDYMFVLVFGKRRRRQSSSVAAG